ncbi:hypothetical protein AFM16_00325 [Streptomyces antibioticus]|uniref:Integrase n=1 Tax=Streptomyces antibioticus TaxID=1890 RepID=A0ABX3LU48_STRAT|nr:hypothetical protein AFM16_00325 [Streptomyces antibioticus]
MPGDNPDRLCTQGAFGRLCEVAHHEGTIKKDIVRCLRRFVAHEAYHRLPHKIRPPVALANHLTTQRSFRLRVSHQRELPGLR